jgi:hypothetical protein
VAFEADVFLLLKGPAETLKAGVPAEQELGTSAEPEAPATPETSVEPGIIPVAGGDVTTLRLVGTVPPEVWNRLGTKILPKLKSGSDLKVGVEFSVTVSADIAASMASELQQIVDELGLAGTVRLME